MYNRGTTQKRKEVKKSQKFPRVVFLRLSLQKKKRIESANSHQNVTLFDDDDDDKNAPRGLFSAAGVLFPRRWWCVVCLFLLLLLFDVNSIVFLSLSLSPRSVLYGGR
jgi:hypothetical protein